MPVTAMAADGIVSGNCGVPTSEGGSYTDAVQWSFDSSTGVLTISGTGAMASMRAENDRGKAPWIQYLPQITSIAISEGITEIGECAFIKANKADTGAVNLISVSFPSTLKAIKFRAFEEVALESIDFPNGLETIEDNAFRYAFNTNKNIDLVIPASVKAIGTRAFASLNQNGTGKISLTFEKNTGLSIGEFAFQSSDTSSPYTGDLVLPEGLTLIGKRAFEYGTFSSLTIPSTVNSMGQSAFKGWNAQTITISDGCSVIGANAFEGSVFDCSLVIPGSVKTLGNAAFKNAEIKKGIILSSGVSGDKDNVFEDCKTPAIVVLTSEEMQQHTFLDSVNEKIVYIPGDRDDIKITSNTTVLAVLNGGTFSKGTTFENNKKLVTPEKTGYNGSWYYIKSDTEKPVDNNTLVEDVKKYYTKWTLKNPTVTVSTDKSIIAPDETATLTATPSHEAADVSYSYQWYKDDAAIQGATAQTFSASETGSYSCKVTVTDGSDSKSVVSAPVYITKSAAAGSVTITNNKTEAFYGEEPFTFTYTANAAAVVDSSDRNVAAVSDNNGTVTVTIVGVGETEISVSIEGSEAVSPASDKFTLKVFSATPELILTANGQEELAIRGGGTVTLAVAGVPKDEVSVSCKDNEAYNPTKNNDGTYTVYLPNQTADYIFVATYAGDANHNGDSDECKVSVTRKRSGSSNSGSSSASTKNEVSADKVDNGSIKLDTDEAKKGDTVTFTVKPDAGYEVDEVTVTDKNGNEIKVKDNGDGTYSFTMPASEVEIDATFEEVEDAFAEETEKAMVLTIGSTIVNTDGSYAANDVAPVVRGERTMLPIRIIAEYLGATVTWNEAEAKVTITKGDVTIEIYIGQPFALVNGQPVQLDAPAFIENDRTYLPLRFVAEALGATVLWDADTNTVTIIPNK